jgi:hypothetical protein
VSHVLEIAYDLVVAYDSVRLLGTFVVMYQLVVDDRQAILLDCMSLAVMTSVPSLLQAQASAADENVWLDQQLSIDKVCVAATAIATATATAAAAAVVIAVAVAVEEEEEEEVVYKELGFDSGSLEAVLVQSHMTMYHDRIHHARYCTVAVAVAADTACVVVNTLSMMVVYDAYVVQLDCMTQQHQADHIHKEVYAHHVDLV